MLKIGLTGGIGSGKSTIAKIFEILGIPVYYADEAARRVMNEDPDLKTKIREVFGPEAYLDGGLNRAFISSQVFNNKEKLKLLNAITHPATIRDSQEWMKRQNTAYAIKEAALIFESGSEQYLDYVMGVFAPEEIRIGRAMNRDSITREMVLNRMKNQMDEGEKMKKCDFLIYNDEVQAVIPQVLTMHGQLLELAKQK